jgi:hypothetical protein
MYPIDIIRIEQLMLIKELIEIYPEDNTEHTNTQWEPSSVLLGLVLHFRGLKLIDEAVNTVSYTSFTHNATNVKVCIVLPI